MNNELLYLKPNVVVEPLIDQWYAWAQLIAPATAAMNVVERHLKIMESYVKAPQVHASAVKNPAMLGGPFVDYEGKRVDEIRALIQETKQSRKQMIQMYEAIRELDAMLQNEANGYSLEPLYSKVPKILQGYVELVYDLNNQPSYRLIEPLLYRSEYYDPSRQSFMLGLINDDDRPFVLSTPRLKDPDEVHLRMPFRSGSVDELFRMKTQPRTFSSLKDILGFPDQDDTTIKTLFTTEAPPKYQRYDGEGARWRYFGHACILLETKDTTILLDPVLSYTYDNKISRYTYQDLPDQIDYVLITHNHQDHILFETMLQIRHRVKTILVPRGNGGTLQDPSLKLLLNAVGFENVIELDEFDEVKTPTGSITALPFFGEHCDLFIRTKAAWLVRTGRHRLLFAADSCNIEYRLYDHIRGAVGDADALFLGMECDGAPMSWIYGPLLTKPMDRKMDQSRRFAGSNYEQAISIVDRFNFKEVYVYAMGQEPWLNYVMSLKYTDESNPIVQSNKLIDECRKRGLISERLFGEKEILLS